MAAWIVVDGDATLLTVPVFVVAFHGGGQDARE